ncbi:hypothetical protein F4054_04795 [Candidatus Poribacteria bacterium]|nr:hypothetical protein [Candidatus Poribacteria bacterium]MYK21561.1 hypothetical protein [Candidatus Poribacteria bacterium]
MTGVCLSAMIGPAMVGQGSIYAYPTRGGGAFDARCVDRSSTYRCVLFFLGSEHYILRMKSISNYPDVWNSDICRYTRIQPFP